LDFSLAKDTYTDFYSDGSPKDDLESESKKNSWRFSNVWSIMPYIN